jgi:cysteine-rich repeat protein
MFKRKYLKITMVLTLSVLCIIGSRGIAPAATGALSGAAVPIPDNPRLEVGDQTNVALQLFNFSSSTEPLENFGKKIGVDVVSASLILACFDSSCITEIPGTFTFLGCDNLHPCVTSCSPNGTNQVDFDLNDCSIGPQGSIVLGEVRLRLESLTPLQTLDPDAVKFFMGGDARYIGSAGVCVNGECDNAEALHTCTDDAGCDWSSLTADATGSADILIPICGDGIVDQDEECDDGNFNNFDECRNDCTLQFCGDGILDPNEECDDGENNSDTEPDACRTDCTLPICGDGIVDTGEECDRDPNTRRSPDNLCRDDCTLPRCGDGVIDDILNEECDDGNDINDDECRNDCTIPFCGDGILDPGEECDDGENNSDTESDACRTDCTLQRCGDGITG